MHEVKNAWDNEILVNIEVSNDKKPNLLIQ